MKSEGVINHARSNCRVENCASVEPGTIFWHEVKIKYNRTMNNDTQQVACGSCGRPFQYGRPVCGCAQPTGTAEYCPGRHGDIVPGTNDCVENATIAQVTVDTIDGITNLASCFVYVTSTNTTYYIDDKHRILTAWKGVVEAEEYDLDENKLNLRGQLLFTTVENEEGEEVPITVYYDNQGKPHVTNEEGEYDADFTELKRMIREETAAREADIDNVNTALAGKQPMLTQGPGIEIDSLNTISNSGVLNLYPGQNVQVSGYNGDVTISATDTTYSAGTGIAIDANNVISVTEIIKPGWGIVKTDTLRLTGNLAPNGYESFTVDLSTYDFDRITDYAILVEPERNYADDTWINLECVWSRAGSSTTSAEIIVHNKSTTGYLPATVTFRYVLIADGYGGGGGGGSTILYPSTGQHTDGAMTQKAVTDNLNTLTNNLNNAQSNLQAQIDNKASISALDAKQNVLTAGSNVVISNDIISAVDTKYTAGTGISIDSNNVISATGTPAGAVRLLTGTTDIGEGVLLAENTIYGVYE